MYTVDLYRRVRFACHVDGLSQREAARRLGLSRETVKKMLTHSVPPGYRRREPAKRPKLGPFTSIVDRILEDDQTVHRKQRHTAKRIFDRLRDEQGFDGGETIGKDYVRERRRHPEGSGPLSLQLFQLLLERFDLISQELQFIQQFQRYSDAGNVDVEIALQSERLSRPHD